MKVEVLLFAQLKESFGVDRIVIDVPDGATVREVADGLMQSQGGAGRQSMPVAYAVREAFVGGDRVLVDGDRLALIPPVSGG